MRLFEVRCSNACLTLKVIFTQSNENNLSTLRCMEYLLTNFRQIGNQLIGEALKLFLFI